MGKSETPKIYWNDAIAAYQSIHNDLVPLQISNVEYGAGRLTGDASNTRFEAFDYTSSPLRVIVTP